MRHGSIYFRLIVPFGLTILAAMVAAWAIAIYLLSGTFDERVDEQIDHATAILAEAEFPFSPELLSRLDRLIEARIALFDDAGIVRLSTATGDALEALQQVGEQIGPLDGSIPGLMTSEYEGATWRIVIRPLIDVRDNRFRYVAAAASMADARQATRDAAQWLAAAMLFAAVILAVSGILVTRSLTRPLGELANMADRIADGERELSTTYGRDDEIGKLARALNHMSERLSTYEQELSERSHLAGLGDLAARLAHEIRNPLTAIKMQLQLLGESQPGDDRVQTVLNEIRRMEMIVESGLTLAAPITLSKVETDVADIVDEVASLVAPALAHRSIDLAAGYPAGVRANVDPDRLKQVLLNLINNGADELADGGRIRISAPRPLPHGEAVIVVEDSGPGLGVDSTAAATKPFGLGLGLKICREIVTAHGGSISAGRSESLGGAAFTITIPTLIIGSPGQEG